MSLKPPSDTVPTAKEFVAAVKKNNYPQARGSLFEIQVIHDTPKLYACAAGQGLLNLGLITEEEIIQAFKEATIEYEENKYLDDPYETIQAIDYNWAYWLDNEFGDIYRKVWNMNDLEHLTPQEIGEKLEKSLDD